MNLKSMKFGLQKQEKDVRDYNAETLGISPSESVQYIELELPDFVYHQGQTDMCTAFSSTMMMTILNSSKDDNGNKIFPLQFSQADIYASKNTSGEGGQLRDILGQLRKRGVALDSLYNHKGTFEECKNLYQENKYVADAQAELGRIVHYYEAETELDMTKALELDKPLFAYLNVYDDFFPNSDGYIHECTGQYLGAHAILIVGIKDYNGKTYVKILNSWGDWGIDGCAWIPYDMIKLAYVPVDSNMEFKSIYFQVGTDYYVKNGIKYYMTGLDSSGNEVPVSPYIEDGRTMIPLKYAIEASGGNVEWMPVGQVIYITQ